MFATHKRRWLIFAVALALTAVVSIHAFDPDFGPSQHLSFAILPCIGSLALLPSDPGAWMKPEVRAAITLPAFAPAVPPRAPPV